MILLAYVEKHGFDRSWPATLVVTVAVVAMLVLAVGDLLSTKFRGRNDQAVFADLERLGREHQLSPADLIITKTGAEHICNWFYRVKSGVITSLTLADFRAGRRVYVLNPLPSVGLEGHETRKAESEADSYFFMQRSIPRPSGVEQLFATENLELFLLDRAPVDWEFDEDGRWLSY